MISLNRKTKYLLIALAVMFITAGAVFAAPPGGHTIIGYFNQPGDYTSGANFMLYDISTLSAVAQGTPTFEGGYTLGADGINENIQNVSPSEETGDIVVVIFDRETDAGTISHAGYYSVNDRTLNGAIAQVSWGDAPLPIPRPIVSLNISGTVEISWNAAIDQGSGNILGYNLYRGTDGINFTQINSATLTDTTTADSSAAPGSTYYYALSIVYRGTLESGSLTEIESLSTSSNSNPVTVGTPGVSIISVFPYWGFQNTTVEVAIIGSNTNFTPTSEVRLEGLNHVTVESVSWFTPTFLTAIINISSEAVLGPRNVVVTTGTEVAVGQNMFWVVSTEATFICNPAQGVRGGTFGVNLNGINTNFNQANSLAYFGPDVVINNLTVSGSLDADVNISINADAILGTRVVIVQSGTEVAIGDFEIRTMPVDDGIIANYPNPFDPQIEVTNIVIDLDEPTEVGIYVYDITARQVFKEVVYLPAGQNIVQWDGYTYYDKISDNGVYLLRVIDEDSREFIGKGKILVIKR